MRKRRKDEFDGNFDPASVSFIQRRSGGGGTLPRIDPEDDGMGGRLGTGDGGIISPYAAKPSTPIAGGVGGQQYQNQQYPQMQQMANVGGAGVSEKQALRMQYTPDQQQQAYNTPHHHTPSVSSGSHYPATLASSAGPYIPNQHLNPLPGPYTPGLSSDGSSSVGGGVYYHPQSGPSPRPSVLSSSSGGRHAKEMEAMGRVVANPDEAHGQFPAFQAYLQNGPGPHQPQQYPQSSSSSASPAPVPSHQYQNSQPQTAGSAVVVHADGGRVVLRKGGDAEGEGEVLSPEIPPTYDSLPVDVRRDN